MLQEIILFDFNPQADPRAWTVVNDGVMGGVSDSELVLNEEGNGVFSGDVSLANNGGFASVRLRLQPLNISGYNTISLRVKGDGKRYQFRVKSSWGDFQSYIAYFDTTGEWQEINIPLKSMYPTFRGQKLDMPNYPAEDLSELSILIGNKKEESFHLEIDRIRLSK